MTTIVQKFGGTSLATVELIKKAAIHVKKARHQNYSVVVVVSAMAGVTNQLLKWSQEAAGRHHCFNAEQDAVISAGEQITSGLLALALQGEGIAARSWQGWQLPLFTNNSHGCARIQNIQLDMLKQSLNEGEVAVVSGFQGITAPDFSSINGTFENPQIEISLKSARLTTLGRGGSDTSAVALAAALKAFQCDIYTDVDGIYTADPRIVPEARKLSYITYEEILELASHGAKVLQPRSVEIAMKYDVNLRVLSSFVPGEGTWVIKKEDNMEYERISGISYNPEEVKIILKEAHRTPSLLIALFKAFAQAEIPLDMVAQNSSYREDVTDIVFVISQTHLEETIKILQQQKNILGYKELLYDANLAKVSVVGIGIRNHASVTARMLQALENENIGVEAISASEIKLSALVARHHIEAAVRALHQAYKLEGL